jgi:radical SAM protein with 4Fe4S-binding SPASM domain
MRVNTKHTVPTMNLPFLSPYLHPMRLLACDGRQELWFDHCIGGRRHKLTPDEVRLVSVLWPKHAEKGTPSDAPDALRALADEIGSVPLSNVLHSLFGRGFLFSDPTSCDRVLLSTLESFLGPVPLVDQVEITNHCPMQCRFCPRGIPGAITRPHGRMRLELFEALLDQLPKRQQTYHPLELDLMGESLLHPEVHRFVEAASHRGIPSELSVNPSLLTPELSRRLMCAGISRLVVSLDGMNNAVLAAMRGKVASYDKAAANLLTLFSVAEERTHPPQIVIQMIDFDRNRDQQKEFLETWGGTGKAFVTAYIKPLDGADPDTGQRHETSPRFLCTYPFASVSVLWDGSVVPCCRDANGRYVLGNLNENSLEEIWRGPRAEQLRVAYRRDEFGHGHLCEDCPWRRSRYAAALWERHPERAVFEPMHW